MADRKAVLIRIPSDLWANLNRWARDELRSLNAQIEFILREAVRRRAGQRASQNLLSPPAGGPPESAGDDGPQDAA